MIHQTTMKKSLKISNKNFDIIIPNDGTLHPVCAIIQAINGDDINGDKVEDKEFISILTEIQQSCKHE